MEIKFIGHSCFEIKGKTATLVIDPYDPSFVGYKLPKLKADILLTTHTHDDHAFLEGVDSKDSDNPYLLVKNPGEYERQGVYVLGFSTFHDAEKGGKRGKNTIYWLDVDGFKLLHLGDLGHELSKEVLEKLPAVDVLLAPVGGTYTLDAKQAVNVISSLEPGFVVPMHYQMNGSDFEKELLPIEPFLTEMGVEGQVDKRDVLKLTSRSDVPEETEVVLLNPQH